MKKLPDNWIVLDLEQLVKAPWNYKKEEEEKQKKLVENIKRNGQIENILVRELDTGFYEVVNGNHRYDAFEELKIKKVICYNLGKISEKEAIRKAIETNETKFQIDPMKHSSLINELIEEYGKEDLLLTMPYTEREFDHYEEVQNFTGDYEDGEFDASEFEDKKGEMNEEHRLPIALSDYQYEAIMEAIDQYVNKFKVTQGEALVNIVNFYNDNNE